MQLAFGYPRAGARAHASDMEQQYSELPNSVISAANGMDYAYRDSRGDDGAVPLVLLQNFRGNLDNWIPCWSTHAPAPAE